MTQDLQSIRVWRRWRWVTALAMASQLGCASQVTTTLPGQVKDGTSSSDIATPDGSAADTPADDQQGDTSAGDAIQSKLAWLCNPCQANAQCQGPGAADGRCVARGSDGAFCGVACTAAADCPDSYACEDGVDVTGAAVKQCLPAKGALCACSESALAIQASTTCYAGTAGATCKGERTCLPAGKPGAPAGGGLSACSASAPATETCDGKDNDCDGKTDEGSCDDGKSCTDDLCGGASGCQHADKPGPCDDGNPCTTADTCQGGTCQGGAAPKCDDGNPCTDDSCDPKKGCVAVNNASTCDFDNTECTVDDVCQAGACTPGPQKACNSGDACVTGTCSKVSGKCVYKAKSEGSPCDDGNACTVADACVPLDAAAAECKGTKVDCDDKNPCTADSCVANTGCGHQKLSGSACSDDNVCTLSDACDGGVCLGLPMNVTAACDDKNACSIDTCDPKLGCQSTTLGTDGLACDDGNACTTDDACQVGVCASGKNSCKCSADADCAKQEDGNFCNGTLYCDKSKLGQFVCVIDPSSIVQCDVSVDGACQSNICNPASGKCTIIQAPSGLACDADGNACTLLDACSGGKCLPGAVLPCDDKNACTSDSCDAKLGCVFTPNTSPCDADGNACSQGDICASGQCTAGKLKACNDLEPCTKDSCDSATAACIYTPMQQSCSDDNACTSGDTCGISATSGKYTCNGGKPVNCDDGSPCTADACDAQKGCSHTPDMLVKVSCYSGDPKTAGLGKCKNGSKACQADGSLGACVGEVVPANQELCNAIDDTCDGITDEGCGAGSFHSEFGVAMVSGSGPKFKTVASVGAGAVAGAASSQGKVDALFGVYVWLKGLTGL